MLFSETLSREPTLQRILKKIFDKRIEVCHTVLSNLIKGEKYEKITFSAALLSSVCCLPLLNAMENEIPIQKIRDTANKMSAIVEINNQLEETYDIKLEDLKVIVTNLLQLLKEAAAKGHRFGGIQSLEEINEDLKQDAVDSDKKWRIFMQLGGLTTGIRDWLDQLPQD